MIDASAYCDLKDAQVSVIDVVESLTKSHENKIGERLH